MNNEIVISNHQPQDITIEQQDNQLIFVNGGGGEVIGITDVFVNGNSVVQNNIAYVIVPTKTSELINDSGFITNETDPTVPSYVKAITIADINNWNNKQNALISGTNIKTINNTSLLGSGNLNVGGVNYVAGNGIEIIEDTINNTITSYNDLTDLPIIPTKTSELINDNNFIDGNTLSEVAYSGDYNDLINLPSIPQNTSDLVNDSGYITNNVNNLTSYMLTTDINTALATKQDTLINGTNIKTINNMNLLGSGNLSVEGTIYSGGNEISISNNVISTNFETGSFTPEIDGNTTSATITYSLQTGRYQKIGKVVYYDIKLTITSINGGSGLIKIKGIPYLSNIDSYFSNIGNVMCLGDLFGNNNIRTLWSAGNDLIISDINNGIGGLPITNTTNTNYLYCTGSFMIN